MQNDDMEMQNTEDPLNRAEKLIDSDELNEAQVILDGIDEHDARWHFMQSKLFLKKNWHNEARKQLEIAVRLDPDNEEYKSAYDHLKNEKSGGEMHDVKKNKFDGCAECCCLASCECCGEGLCAAICDGCS